MLVMYTLGSAQHAMMGFTPCAQILLMQPEETPTGYTINVL